MLATRPGGNLTHIDRLWAHLIDELALAECHTECKELKIPHGSATPTGQARHSGPRAAYSYLPEGAFCNSCTARPRPLTLTQSYTRTGAIGFLVVTARAPPSILCQLVSQATSPAMVISLQRYCVLAPVCLPRALLCSAATHRITTWHATHERERLAAKRVPHTAPSNRQQWQRFHVIAHSLLPAPTTTGSVASKPRQLFLHKDARRMKRHHRGSPLPPRPRLQRLHEECNSRSVTRRHCVTSWWLWWWRHAKHSVHWQGQVQLASQLEFLRQRLNPVAQRTAGGQQQLAGRQGSGQRQ
jgi:hypothetical protein